VLTGAMEGEGQAGPSGLGNLGSCSSLNCVYDPNTGLIWGLWKEHCQVVWLCFLGTNTWPIGQDPVKVLTPSSPITGRQVAHSPNAHLFLTGPAVLMPEMVPAQASWGPF
jgi:hypothetical protein